MQWLACLSVSLVLGHHKNALSGATPPVQLLLHSQPCCEHASFDDSARCFCASCVRGRPHLHALTAARLFRRCFAKCSVGGAMPPATTDRPADTLPTSPDSADDCEAHRSEDKKLTHTIIDVETVLATLTQTDDTQPLSPPSKRAKVVPDPECNVSTSSTVTAEEAPSTPPSKNHLRSKVINGRRYFVDFKEQAAWCGALKMCMLPGPGKRLRCSGCTGNCLGSACNCPCHPLASVYGLTVC